MSSSSVTDPATENEALAFRPSPREEWTLLSQGAEARVWKLEAGPSKGSSSDGNGNGDGDGDGPRGFLVCKERFSKAYRHPDLDLRLTKSRCRSEAKLLGKCASRSAIRVPRVVRVDPPSLYLEYLAGPSVKSYLQGQQRKKKQQQEQQQQQEQRQQQQQQEEEPPNGESKSSSGDTTAETALSDARIPRAELARRMGQLLGRLHNIGIVHGDLTTSNMVLLPAESKPEPRDDDTPSDGNGDAFELALIDFGLSKSTDSSEEQAVDLYVLERALLSTHPDLPGGFFETVLEEYKATTEGDQAPGGDAGKSKKRKNHCQSALVRLEQVRMRGRKRECFG